MAGPTRNYGKGKSKHGRKPAHKTEHGPGKKPKRVKAVHKGH